MGRHGRVGLAVFVLVLVFCEARRHKLALKNDTRFVVHLNTFGFFANGNLDVNVLSLRLPEDNSKHPVGFSLSKSRVNGVLSYTAEETEVCPLSKQSSVEPLFLFLIDTNILRVNVKSYGDQDSVLTQLKTDKTLTKDSVSRRRRLVPNDSEDLKVTVQKSNVEEEKKDTVLKEEGTKEEEKPELKEEEVKAQLDKMETKKPTKQVGRINGLTLDVQKINGSYSFSFHMVIGQLDEGLYNLNFHYCENILPGTNRPYNLNVEVTEKNPGGYLSAAEILLPRLYIFMAGVFFIIAMVWVYTLLKHRYSVFKIHWLMAALAFTKSISLVFHSINYHFINTEGHPIEGWAVMYYITHLLKGVLLFITLALIGTGWAFVKYILSDKEKKIFMIVIPLQVLANVAYIIIESTEEGSSEYTLWKKVLFLVDLICCGAILFPVVWSIRHLQEASSTDGKAAMKLKLFRHYYVMIVCYIYFTRIVAILLKVTVPFQWQWCYEFLVEVSTLIFFVLTGYKFRPASNNPYQQPLPLDEEDVERDEVVTESGMLEGISKVKKTSDGRERQKKSNM
ncbi:protein GPR108-like isoform X1 [Salmo trutta]|uniref:G protein-coupled receptor 108 n=1 Tax=Salmo trutta TaxID=8032 RepID=A0A674BZA2_SALTR|nr:protein GPR108-like isoform X1 [Salmo trutta]